MTANPHDVLPRKSRPLTPPPIGVEIAGTGSSVPERRLTNAELEKVMDTSDEWIVQRTGVRERRISDPAKGENINTFSAAALRLALVDAGIAATDLDLILICTVSMEMTCPTAAAMVSEMVGAGRAGTADITSACAGFVYGLNMGHDLVRAGSYRNVAVIGADLLTRVADYTTEGRGVAILCGDAAGAVILRATSDTSKGLIAQAMHSDGRGWKHLFIPRRPDQFPPNEDPTGKPMDKMYMNGREVFKFAVSTFSDLIQETLDKAGLKPEDVDQYICHQSNARILDAARERFGLPKDKLYINIDRYGNSSSGSVPLCLDELRAAGTVKPGHIVLFVAFGGGLTWASSLWQL
jgi:3-oxoacyl-[acyl-carrier-protein] synthase III